MTVFADASAVVKRYADEPGSDLVRSHDELVLSALSLVEVRSALWRRAREGALTAGEARTLESTFAGEVATWSVVGLGGQILADAGRLVARHPLRAADAVQLACALTARRIAGVASLLCFDEQLGTAAAAEGMDVVPLP